jgi:hypothetical protein
VSIQEDAEKMNRRTVKLVSRSAGVIAFVLTGAALKLQNETLFVLMGISMGIFAAGGDLLFGGRRTDD